MQLLREFVRSILVEESSKFSLRTYVSLYEKDKGSAYAYLKANLKKLGHGGSRITFLLNPRKVLKVIQHDPPSPNALIDIAQNEKEFEIAQSSNIVPRTFYHAHNFTWIISEFVKQSSDREETCAMLGIKKTRDFWNFIGHVIANDLPVKMKQKVAEENEGERVPWSAKLIADFYGDGTRNDALARNVEDLRDLVRIHGITRNELRWEHFGKTADGRVVIFDTGY